MESNIYLIEKIVLDGMECEIHYEILGYVESEDEARKICDNGLIYTSKEIWYIHGKKPEYKYRKIKIFSK